MLITASKCSQVCTHQYIAQHSTEHQAVSIAWKRQHIPASSACLQAQRSTAQQSTAQHSRAQQAVYIAQKNHHISAVSACLQAQRSAAQHSTAQRSISSLAQHSTAGCIYCLEEPAYFSQVSMPPSTAQHSTAQHSTAQHSRQYLLLRAASILRSSSQTGRVPLRCNTGGELGCQQQQQGPQQQEGQEHRH